MTTSDAAARGTASVTRRCLPGLTRAVVLGVLLAAVAARAAAPAGASLHIEELTWTELRDRVAAGATTILVPIGGTEQNGPHIVLGKHNVRVRVLAEMIAHRLGNALVAPVLAYVPEGAIDPPAAHMRFAGTLSIGEATFEAVLEASARSFRQHGFRAVVFLGDHGGYQKNMERVATRLNREWVALPGCRVIALLDFYRVTQGSYVDALKARGHSIDEIGSHAGLADTALALAIDPALVRQELLGRAAKGGSRDGVYGDPRRATAELGQLGVEQIVATSAAKIRALIRAH